MTDHVDMHTKMFGLAPDLCPLFGHTHRSRWEKFREWWSELLYHFRELPQVFKKDFPDKPFLMTCALARHRKAHLDWLDDPAAVKRQARVGQND